MLFSMVVTEGVGFERNDREGMKLVPIDIRRAFFHAEARRAVFVEIPQEDHEPGMCGQLLKSLNGARDAAQNWEYQYSKFVEDVGYTRGVSSSCVLYHDHREIRVVAHGDEFAVLGWETN